LTEEPEPAPADAFPAGPADGAAAAAEEEEDDAIDLEDPMVERASIVIQSGFRGMHGALPSLAAKPP
jgi:hypothetical protein